LGGSDDAGYAIARLNVEAAGKIGTLAARQGRFWFAGILHPLRAFCIN
jgi:hypothetical protein